MKATYLAAGASILHIASAIPALITTVFNCPDVSTVYVTVYPPGYTNTGPVYNSMTSAAPNAPQEGARGGTCPQQGAVTTSWQTSYITTTAYFSEAGMYAGPPGCPTEIMAFMPTTVTCSQAVSTGFVAYVSDLQCQTCTATTVAGIMPPVNTTGFVTIWTEVLYPATATVSPQMVGAVTTANTIPTNVLPYTAACTGASGGSGSGSGSTYTGGAAPQGAPTGYPSIDFSNPSVFNVASSIPIVSAGTASGGSTPAAVTPAASRSGTGYPSVDYSNPTAWQVTQSVSIPGNTVARASGGSSSYYSSSYYTSSYYSGSSGAPVAPASAQVSTINFSNTANFNEASSISIVSATPTPTTPFVQTTTFTVPTNFGSDFKSIDVATASGFDQASSISIVSGAGTFASPTATGNPSATYPSVNYPSIDFSNPTVFTPSLIATPSA